MFQTPMPCRLILNWALMDFNNWLKSVWQRLNVNEIQMDETQEVKEQLHQQRPFYFRVESFLK